MDSGRTRALPLLVIVAGLACRRGQPTVQPPEIADARTDARAVATLPAVPASPPPPIVTSLKDREEPLPGTICYPSGFCWDRPRPQGEDLLGVWAAGPNDVWAVGARGTALHFDGHVWSRVRTGTSEKLVAVWGRSPNDVWMLSEDGGLVRWNGRRIVISLLSAEQEHALDLRDHPDAGAGSDAVDDVPPIDVTDPAMASVEPPEETLPRELQPYETGKSFSGLWGDAKHLWVVGGAAHIQQAQADDDETEVAVVRRFDGRRWTSTVVAKSPVLESVWGRSGDDIWATAQDLRSLSHFSEDRGERTYALHWDGRRWRRAPAVPFEWIVSGSAHLNALLQFDNGRSSGPFWKGNGPSLWELRTNSSISWGDKGAVVQSAVRGASDAGAAVDLDEKIFRDASYGARDIFGTEDGHVWIVGLRGAIHHFDGQHWSGIDPVADEQLYDLNGVTAVGDEIWAVGVHGVLRRQGERWIAIPSGTDANLFAAWGISPDNVWVVGSRGAIVHCGRDGCREVRPPRESPPGRPLTTIAGLGPNDIWTADDKGVGLHWNGKQWAEAPLPAKAPGTKLVAAHGELWLGRHRWDGKSWSAEPFSSLPPTAEIRRG
jgi:hypothetical protein